MRQATITDKKLVIDILASAFAPLAESNSINHVIKQDGRRIERIRVLMEYLFERAIWFGEVYISDNGQACILLKFPHREKITWPSIKSDIRLAARCIGFERVFRVLKRQKVVSRYYPKQNHIRPMIMGVKLEFKGNGTAARLMLEVKNKYNNTELPVIVDAASHHNAKLYQKFGFKPIGTEESLGFPIYFLRLN